MHRDGIIPARAGFTRGVHDPGQSTPDHPRSRGVYRSSNLPRMRRSGSSPLARGLPRRRGSSQDNRGIIPARAGFTCLMMVGLLSGMDHPRSRGVYTRGQECCRQPLGSSPLARGLHKSRQAQFCHGGIIPARAGFTNAAAEHGISAEDHPRSRGVYSKSSAHTASVMGSSPLARGLLYHRVNPLTGAGIIPARAGFTHDAYKARH